MSNLQQATKYSKSAKIILATSKELFWKHGINRVTVEEICEKSSVSKMTFYRNFENKFEVAKIILTKYVDESYDIFSNLFCQEIPFPKKITKFLEIKKEMAKGVSFEFLKDLNAENEFTESLKTFLEVSQSKMMSIVRKSFEEAQCEGWIRSDMKIDFIFYMFDAIGSFSKDDKLLAMFDDSEELTSVLTTFLFRGILSNKTLK